jgi:hypothetical protein
MADRGAALSLAGDEPELVMLIDEAGPPASPTFPTLPTAGMFPDPPAADGAEGVLRAQLLEASPGTATRGVPVPQDEDLNVPTLSCPSLAPKCKDCLEFFASEEGRCSQCARVWRGEPIAKGQDRSVEATPMDVDEKMLMVGAAVVGAGIGALAGAVGAVVGAGAGAYAATRPSGDKIGDSARFAGRGVVQAGYKAQEVAENLKVSEHAQTFERTLSQKARDAKLGERSAEARERLEAAAQNLDRRAREIDSEYQVSEHVHKASAKLEERAKKVAASASSFVRWASAKADEALINAGTLQRRAHRSIAAGARVPEDARMEEKQEEHC